MEKERFMRRQGEDTRKGKTLTDKTMQEYGEPINRREVVGTIGRLGFSGLILGTIGYLAWDGLTSTYEEEIPKVTIQQILENPSYYLGRLIETEPLIISGYDIARSNNQESYYNLFPSGDFHSPFRMFYVFFKDREESNLSFYSCFCMYKPNKDIFKIEDKLDQLKERKTLINLIGNVVDVDTNDHPYIAMISRSIKPEGMDEIFLGDDTKKDEQMIKMRLGKD